MLISPVYSPIPPLENLKILTNDGTLLSWTDTPTLVGLIIADSGYIGSISDTDAIQIEADGDVILTQDLTAANLILSADPSIISSANAIQIKPSGDTDDYLEFYTSGEVPFIKRIGGTSVIFEADSTDHVSFDLWEDISNYAGLMWAKADAAVFPASSAVLFSSGPINFMPNLDASDYMQFTTVDNVPTISTVGTCDLKITASSGEIDFDDENLTTLGTLDVGLVTATGLTLAQDELITLGVETLLHNGDNFVFDDNVEINTTGQATPARILIVGASGEIAGVQLRPDTGGTNTEWWRMTADGVGDPPFFAIESYNGAAWIKWLQIRNTGLCRIWNLWADTADIDGGTVDAITSLTVANNVDIGNFTLTANGLTVDGTITDGTASLLAGALSGVTTFASAPGASSTITTAEVSYFGGALILPEIAMAGSGTNYFGTIKNSLYIRGVDQDAILAFSNSDITASAGITFDRANDHMDFKDAQEYTFDDDVVITGPLSVIGITSLGDGGTTHYTAFAADGLQTMAGTARVVRDIWVPFNALKAPGTKPATFKEWGISGAWEFSDGTDDTVVFNIKFPYDMDKSVAPVICVGWSTNTAVTSETATWQLEYLYTAPGEDTTAAAQATITIDSNAVAQADGLIIATFPAMAVPGSTDICLHGRLKRLGAGGNDDLTDTAELHGVVMQYTSDKLGTAT